MHTVSLQNEKCWAHSPLRAAARRLFYIAIHQMSLLSHAACASMSTTTTTTRDKGDQYGLMEWAQLSHCFTQSISECVCVCSMQGWIVASDEITEPTFVVRNLQSSTSYMFLVRAENSHGISFPSPITAAVNTLGPLIPILYIRRCAFVKVESRKYVSK